MNFLSSSTNIVIQGFTGSGKTYLSCAIAKEACKKDIKTFTIRLPEMLQKRAEEKILHRENKNLHKLASYDYLLLMNGLYFHYLKMIYDFFMNYLKIAMENLQLYLSGNTLLQNGTQD